MNISIISKNDILEVSKQIILDNGVNTINIRDIAKKCGISVGSIYNYFPSKSDLICLTIQSIWEDIFSITKDYYKFNNFSEFILLLIENIKPKIDNYPNFFTIHSLVFNEYDEKTQGKIFMNKYLENLKKTFIYVLNNDTKIKKNIFNEILTKEKFIDYIFNLFISLLFEKTNEYQSFILLIEKYIY